MKNQQLKQINDYTNLIQDIDSKIRTMNKQKLSKRPRSRKTKQRRRVHNKSTLEFQEGENTHPDANFTKGKRGRELFSEDHQVNLKHFESDYQELRANNEFMVNVTQLKDIVYSMVSNFISDFRSSLMSELTGLLNSVSEHNTTRLHSNLDYFREELSVWKSYQDKEMNGLYSKVQDFEVSLSKMVQLMNSRRLLDEPTTNPEATNESPEYDVKIDVTSEDIENLERRKERRRKKRKKGNKRSERSYEEELCNFSSSPTEETEHSHPKSSGIIEFNGGGSFMESTVDIQAEL